MAGVPLGAGFIAKELAYDALAAGGFAGSSLVLAVVVGGSMLTVAYCGALLLGGVRRAGSRHLRARSSHRLRRRRRGRCWRRQRCSL